MFKPLFAAMVMLTSLLFSTVSQAATAWEIVRGEICGS